jgi:glycosyltransferase involved in cell wall biosynthesis
MAPALSVGLPVYNGERFVATALDSLLGQSFRDLEITISDNASTDSTPEICREYARRDGRIKYIRQPANVGLLPNVEFVMRQARGRYCMLVGDDDVYEPEFAAKLIGLLERNPTVGLAHSGYTFIDADGSWTPAAPTVTFGIAHSRFRNCFVYIRVRTCLPLIFGVFRTALFQRALPFVNFGYTTADADNVFMLRFLSLARVASTPDILFHYRTKDRSGILLQGYPHGSLARRLYVFRHQRTVTSLMRSIVDGAQFRPMEKAVLKAHANLALVLNTLP